MAMATKNDTSGARDLSIRARVALFAVALMLTALSACQKDAVLDPFIGPSELALSLTLSASPDVLALDGASQSLVTILARDGAGQVVANVTVRLQIRFGGTLQDVGELSARTLVTGQNGEALATYTAPLSLSGVDSEAQVEILATPVGDNYASAVPRTLRIRLVPIGTVIPPATFTADFQFSPASPEEFEEVLFQSTDQTGQIVKHAWDFGDGTTGTGSTATHTYTTASTYIVTLTATDSYDRTTSLAQSVTIGGGPTPTADFTFSPAAPKIGFNVFFNAADSAAPAGRTIVSYAWAFGDGATASGTTATHFYTLAALFNVTLTVTDDRGAVGSLTRSVTVTSSPPTARFVFSPADPTKKTVVQFNAGTSTPASGRTINSYAWNFGDGSTGTGVTVSHRFTAVGDYDVVLTVTDSDGEINTATETVTVSDIPNSGGPTASFTISPNPTTVGTLTTVNAAASTPPDGATITNYMWNFGDSTATSTCSIPAAGGDDPACVGATPWLLSYTYMDADDYTITLTVTDSLGQTHVKTEPIEVESPP